MLYTALYQSKCIYNYNLGPVRCPQFSEQCGTANYCYREPRWRTCDGHADCPNAADERHENCIPSM